MKVLVTGGAGFIGSQFVRRLVDAGDEVVVLDKLTYAGNRANLDGVEHEFHEGDIADPDAVARAADGVDAIVNFAAETHVDRSIMGPAEFILTDVLGTQVLLDYARRNSIRHLQVSTDEVYGDVPLDAPPCTEEAPIRASSPYSASKAGGDLQVLAYVRTYGVDALVTRGANTYGPRQYPEKFLPLFITNAFERQPLPVYGDGRQRREWLHVEDHCAGIELALKRGEGGNVYNIGGQERENLDVVRRILDLTNASPDLVRHVTDRGTARTASGGSRSSPGTTSGTTSSSTPLAFPSPPGRRRNACARRAGGGRSPAGGPGSPPIGRAVRGRRCNRRVRIACMQD
jgi:dTDP-glucose 4,6-dehydratase